MKKFARTLKARIENIVTFCTHRNTNGVAEGIKSKIMAIKRRVGGYRNRENLKLTTFSTEVGWISTHGNPGWTKKSMPEEPKSKASA